MAATEKQGHLGSLSGKTVCQLQELLDRENNILKNVKFVEKLADKGQKIKKLAKQIETELQSRMEVDSTADLITKMSLQSTHESTHDVISCEEEAMLRGIINRPQEKTIVMEKKENVSDPSQFINSYERVIKRAEKNVSPKKFYAHKSLKADTEMPSVHMEVSKDVISLDEPPPLESPLLLPLSGSLSTSHPQHLLKSAASKRESETIQLGDFLSAAVPKSKTSAETVKSESNTKDSVHSDVPSQEQHTAHKTMGQSSHLKHKYDESLESSNFRPTKYERAKIVSIEESVHLIQAQRIQQEKLHAHHAAERLSEKMGVKMCDYEPKEVQMRYRNPRLSESEASSDSENEEIDYPD